MNEEHGAGFEGTDALVRKYRMGTPGEWPRKKKPMKEEAPTMNTGAIPNPLETSQGPRVKEYPVTDRRYKKTKYPVLLKRFRDYLGSKG